MKRLHLRRGRGLPVAAGLVLALAAVPAGADLSEAVSRVQDSVFTLRTGRGVGTGFVVSPAGDALTCAHVVVGADQVETTLANGEEVAARVVARDEQRDLALLRLERAGLPPVIFGDSTKLQSGAAVAAIGASLGLENSVTQGVVSGVDREVEGRRYLQIDAALNQGNSGGPVINSRGEVVGVATATVKEATGVGFAISGAIALDFLREHEVVPATALDVPPVQAPAARPAPGGGPAVPSPTSGPGLPLTLGLAAVVALLVALAVSLLAQRRIRPAPAPGSEPVAPPGGAEDLSDIDIELK